MKKTLLMLLVMSLGLAMVGCSDNKVIDGVEYRTYGIINQKDRMNPKIEYQPVWGNIIWGCILIETIVGPIYFFGFDMFEPVGVKSGEPR